MSMGLYDAEDRRIGAYSERKRQQSDKEEDPLTRQNTTGKANVLQNHIRYTLRKSVWFGSEGHQRTQSALSAEQL